MAVRFCILHKMMIIFRKASLKNRSIKVESQLAGHLPDDITACAMNPNLPIFRALKWVQAPGGSLRAGGTHVLVAPLSPTCCGPWQSQPLSASTGKTDSFMTSGTAAKVRWENWDVDLQMCHQKQYTTAETNNCLERDLHIFLTAICLWTCPLQLFLKLMYQRRLGLIKLDQTCKAAVGSMELIWLQGTGTPADGAQRLACGLSGSVACRAPGHSLSTMTPRPRAAGRQGRASEWADSSQGCDGLWGEWHLKTPYHNIVSYTERV